MSDDASLSAWTEELYCSAQVDHQIKSSEGRRVPCAKYMVSFRDTDGVTYCAVMWDNWVIIMAGKYALKTEMFQLSACGSKHGFLE